MGFYFRKNLRKKYGKDLIFPLFCDTMIRITDPHADPRGGQSVKTLLFVYNPNAGKGRVRPILADLAETFDANGYSVTVRPTRGRGDITAIVSENAEAYDRIVVSGGDGSLNEALGGLLDAEAQGKRIPDLGYVPTGSTNDFSATLGLPQDPVKAAKVAATGEVFLCDAGSFNGRPFVYIAAFGAFTKVSYSTSQKTKNALGHLAYVLEGMKELPQIRGIPLRISTDTEQFEGRYLYGMVSNTTSVGGFNNVYSPSDIALDDGLLEVLLIREPESFAAQSELFSDLLRMNLKSRHVTLLKTSRISFQAQEPLPWTLDGEFGGESEMGEIRALPNAYRIVVPSRSEA